MARRNASSSNKSDTTPAPAEVQSTEETTVTETVTTEAPVEADAPAPEAAPVKVPTPEADFGPFEAAVASALEGKDAATGELAPAFIEPVSAAFRALDGAKNKNKAKVILNEGMKDAMGNLDIQTARAYMTLSDKATVVAPHAKAEKIPADPTEAFVQRVVGLKLALDLTQGNVPEGVKENWTEQATALIASSMPSAQEYLAWTKRAPAAENTEDLREPEVTAFVKGAVKLAQGKTAKIGGKVSRVAGTPFMGERRDIGKHIVEAFASKSSGDFLTVSEIRNFHSEEYGDNLPSAGAISARLFPKSGKFTIEGVEPATSNDGKASKGATKS